MALCQPKRGKEDEHLHAEVSEEGEERLDGVRGLTDLVQEDLERAGMKPEFVLPRGADGMEEVVQNDGEDGQRFEHGGVAMVQLVESGGP